MTAAVQWDPADYAAHSASQLAWARELLARLRLRGDERILDVGCGDGKVTAELARAVPRGRVTGVDRSRAMIRFARAHYPPQRHPNLRFAIMDARRLRTRRPYDIVFSNAALHWVDDPQAFLRGAARCLIGGGWLVVSCGGRGNAQEMFLAVRATIRHRSWRGFFRGLRRPYHLRGPEDYERWLPRFGFEPVLLRLTPRQAVFADRAALEGWFRTTWLPYTQRVPQSRRSEFIAAVCDHYLASHPPDGAGRVSVGMVRLEIEAIKLADRPVG